MQKCQKSMAPTQHAVTSKLEAERGQTHIMLVSTACDIRIRQHVAQAPHWACSAPESEPRYPAKDWPSRAPHQRAPSRSPEPPASLKGLEEAKDHDLKEKRHWTAKTKNRTLRTGEPRAAQNSPGSFTAAGQHNLISNKGSQKLNSEGQYRPTVFIVQCGGSSNSHYQTADLGTTPCSLPDRAPYPANCDGEKSRLRCHCEADFENICWCTSHHKVQGEHVPHELGVVADGVSNLSDETAELESITGISGKLLFKALGPIQ